jgi:hypothetical protein
VRVVGGPNLCPPESPVIEKIFALVLGSWLAFGPSRARYVPVGKVRATSEKELILCNLLAQRAPLLERGGFNEKLYPNEENALMDDLQKSGQLIYDPEFAVERRPRPNLKAFMKMLRTYGRGRAEQFRVHPTPGSALNFVPPLFLIYVLVLAVALPLLLTGSLPVSPFWIYPLLAPLGLYLAAVCLQSVALVPRGGLAHSLGAFPLIILTHLLYGYGFWRGLFTSLKPPNQSGTGAADGVKVVLEHVMV